MRKIFDISCHALSGSVPGLCLRSARWSNERPIEDEDDDGYEDESLAPSHLSFQPNRTERLETDLGLGESLGTEFEPNS